MTPERWKRTEDLYHAARARAPGERAAFLAEACPDDEVLRRDVESLLHESESDAGFLASPAVAMSPQLLSDLAPQAMAGRSLGAYQLQTLVGAGGMGEVYRARDTKLARDVAIKILPQEFTSDPDRLARFEREARMLAALNHPNICAIYGFEEADGIRFLILELVDGETLADTLAHESSVHAKGEGLPARSDVGHRAADRRGPRSRPRKRDRPPRPEAREHQDHAGRSREGSGLRPRQGRRWQWLVARPDACTRDDSG